MNGITTDYSGNYVYETEVQQGSRTPFRQTLKREQNGQLQFFNHAEGYFEVTGTPPSGELEGAYVYQYKDHLGNIRLSYKNNNGTLQILEENNYYPFGLKHKGYNNVVNSTNTALKYKYNGKELNESLGLNLYEMDFRQYDPAIARFTSIDPVTHFSQSTYTAFDNNPVFWADPSGADSQTVYDFDGNAYTVNCENGECGNEEKQFEETGADGVTNSQWVESSKVGGGGFDGLNEQRKNNLFEFYSSKRDADKVKKAIKIANVFIENLIRWAYYMALIELASGDEVSILRNIHNMEKIISVSFPDDVVRNRSDALKRSWIETMNENRDYGSIIFGKNYTIEDVIINNPNGDFGFIYKSGANVFYQNSGYPEHTGQGFMDNTFANYTGILFKDKEGNQVGALFFKTKKLYNDFVKYFNETLVQKFKEELSKNKRN